MPQVRNHPQGEPCWAELSTTDEKGALKFYSGLFGWKDEAQPMGPGQFYHMQKLGKETAAALYQQSPEEKGMPANWRVYFAVNSADETAKKVKSAGGKVVMEPFDVFDAGRMTVAQDPSGAFVSFWQANKHIGYTVFGEPGAVTWSELMSRDSGKALSFYRSVIGVRTEEMAMGQNYNLLKVGEKQVAGVMAMPKEVPAMVPSYWVPYFEVADADAAAKKVAALGGKVIVPVQAVPNVGRFSMISDPQGATFGILQPAAR